MSPQARKTQTSSMQTTLAAAAEIVFVIDVFQHAGFERGIHGRLTEITIERIHIADFSAASLWIADV